MRHDRLVLALIGHDLRRHLRGLSLSDVLWITGGGGLLLAYGIADIWIGLRAHSTAFRNDAGLWLVRAPEAIALTAAALAVLAARASARHALAPFLKALPIAGAARRRMALVAGLALGIPVVVLTVVTAAWAAAIMGKPAAIAWGLGEGTVATAAFAAVLSLRLRTLMRADAIHPAAPRRPAGLPLFTIGIVDRVPLPWLGSWAWRLPRGRVMLTARFAAVALVVTLGEGLAIGASLAQGSAVPAAVASLIGGFAVFMLTIRFQPLQSPVLRSTPLGFGHVWRRLTRLPLILSAVTFALPAGAATAAEPATITGRVQDGIGLAILDGTYAVFAAYFAGSPLAGALGFFGTVFYAIYEASELGGAMIIGVAGLLALLWGRARARYRHG